MEINFRPLRADEVELRVDRYTYNGAVLLLYKDARCDMRILDETVGKNNWDRDHFECKGNLFCKVGIFDGDKWVWKSDCGTESNTEKEKGEASDSFKRACFNWGIGRELYTKINIVVPMKTAKNDKGKYEPQDSKDRYAKFYVHDMDVEDEKITRLTVSNADGEIVFSYGDNAKEKLPNEYILTINDAFSKGILDKSVVLDYYKATKVEDLTVAQGIQVLRRITKLSEEKKNENKPAV